MNNQHTSLAGNIQTQQNPPLLSVLQRLTEIGADKQFFGSITLRFQGPLGLVYVVTERGQRPQELVQEVQNVRA